MSEFVFTKEQSDILNHIQQNDGISMVSAGAGCGKSFIAHQIAKYLQPTKGLYTAFNKAIVAEGEVKFENTAVECKTLHALAYKYCRPSRKIEDLSYTCIKEKISYAAKYDIIQAINTFYVSASTDMYEFMDEILEDEYRKELACKYIEMMVSGEIAPTFNFLLKFFHLMLAEGTVDCQYDLVILDEINDTTAVALEIFKLINAPKKIGLGEPAQAIYKFLNLVNGFEILKDEPLFHLTHSFRCSEVIASEIQTFMRKTADEEFCFVGTDDPVANGKYLYCTGTNASIVKAIHDRLQYGEGFHLLRQPSEIFACPLAIMSASRGKDVYQKKYKFLTEEYENFQRKGKTKQGFFSYLVETTQDPEVESAVNLLLYFQKNNINLFDLYNRAKEAPVDTRYVIATVFSSKGLEFETVYIADDLNKAVENVIQNPFPEPDSDEMVHLRCYYVAASRAGKTLLNAKHLNT